MSPEPLMACTVIPWLHTLNKNILSYSTMQGNHFCRRIRGFYHKYVLRHCRSTIPICSRPFRIFFMTAFTSLSSRVLSFARRVME